MYDNVRQAMDALIGAGGRQFFKEEELHSVGLRMLMKEETAVQEMDFYKKMNLAVLK